MPPAMRPHLVHAFPYPPGRPIEDVQREYGLSSVIKLASNENPLGPSPKAIEAMKRCAAEMNLYPDGAAYYLRLALAEKHGVEPERIVFGAGSDDLNGFVAMCYVGPGRTLVCSEGSFIRYEQSAIVSGGQARRVPFKNWRHDVDALLGAIDETTGAVCVANPENPAGSMLTRAEVDRLVSGTPDSVLLLLDEAYFEFAENEPDYPDSLEYLKSRDNVMVSRTFSKAYGLAGLRVGYAIATADIVQTLDRVRHSMFRAWPRKRRWPPWTIRSICAARAS